MWIRMTLSLGVAAALVAGLVIFVHRSTSDSPSEAPVSDPKAVAEEHREARIVVGQDQRPHFVSLVAGASPAAAISQAVSRYMRTEVRTGAVDGSLTRSSCTRVGGSAARQVWHCTVVVGSVSYPFDSVIEPGARRLTYCKRDPPPVPSMNIPVSSSCT